MGDSLQFFSFWFHHPAVRNRPPSATIFDILHKLMSDTEIREQLGGREPSEESEASNTNIENQSTSGSEDANDHEEEARDTLGNLPRFSPRPIDRRQSDGEQLKQIRDVTPPPPPQVKSGKRPLLLSENTH